MNRFTLYFFYLLLTATIFSVYGQRTVTGRLIDKETGKPVKDALIVQIGADIKTTSNALGFFPIANVTAKTTTFGLRRELDDRYQRLYQTKQIMLHNKKINELC